MVDKRFVIGFCLGIGTCLAPLSGVGEQGKMECSHEVLMSYFPEQFVDKTLNKFQVPQAQRAAIKQELAEKDREVISIVEEKAGRMENNPLRDPQYRQEAVKIFKDTLYELFAKVMQAHGINNKEEIQSMLDDIQQQKAEYFAKCMERSPGQEMTPPREEPPRKSFSRQPRGPQTNHNSAYTEYNEESDELDY